MKDNNFTSTLQQSMLDHYQSLTDKGIFHITTNGTNGTTIDTSLFENNHLEKKIDRLELDIKLLRLKLLQFEGKFTKDEVTNIRKMLMSEDEASRTLATTIIDNA